MSRSPALVLATLALGLAGAPLTGPAGAAEGDAGASRTDRAALPSDPDGLVAFVTGALRARDEDAIERLVNWDGVRPPRRRLTLYQIRTTFGRPIKAATVEDFPPDGLVEAESRGTFKANMPVTQRLRIEFDETSEDAGAPPANVFLVGRKDGVYRIAVMNSVGPPVQK